VQRRNVETGSLRDDDSVGDREVGAGVADDPNCLPAVASRERDAHGVGHGVEEEIEAGSEVAGDRDLGAGGHQPGSPPRQTRRE
jgi:hypothetical protein